MEGFQFLVLAIFAYLCLSMGHFVALQLVFAPSVDSQMDGGIAKIEEVKKEMLMQ